MNGTRDECREAVVHYFRVERRHICYVQFVFEAYDGVATVSTVDSRSGVIKIAVPVSRLEDAAALLQAVEEEVGMERVAAPDAIFS